MNKRWLFACLLPLLICPARADSIDDAEAKRRGVSLAQIQAENALAAQKRKTADAEKQAADLEKQIAEAQIRLSTGNLDSPILPGAITRPAKLATDPALPKLLDGPRKSSPAYDAIIQHYLTGDWTTLLSDIGSKQGSIANLPATNASDIAYIRAAVAQCRPAWWDRVKTGSKTQFQTSVFGQQVSIIYTNGNGSVHTETIGGKPVIDATWPADRMDARTTFGFPGVDVPLISSGRFLSADWAQVSAWQTIGSDVPALEVGPNRIADLERDEKLNLTHHISLYQYLSAYYYGTPTSRFLLTDMIAHSTDPKESGRSDWEGYRMMIPWFLAEVLAHRERYPSLHLDAIQDLPATPPGKFGEYYILQTYLASAVDNAQLTLSEDAALRQALWNYAQDNTDWLSTGTTLSNGLSVPFDGVDGKAAKVRYDWLRQQIAAKPAPTAP